MVTSKKNDQGEAMGMSSYSGREVYIMEYMRPLKNGKARELDGCHLSTEFLKNYGTIEVNVSSDVRGVSEISLRCGSLL